MTLAALPRVKAVTGTFFKGLWTRTLGAFRAPVSSFGSLPMAA